MRSGSMPDNSSSLESLCFPLPPEESMSHTESPVSRVAPQHMVELSVHKVEDVLGEVRGTPHVRLCLSSHQPRW